MTSTRAIALVLALLTACSTAGESTESTGGTPRLVFDGTEEEWALRVVECLRDAGYPAEVDGTEAYVPAISGEARLALAVVADRCSDEVGSMPREPLTPEYLTEHYYDQVATKECLEAEGYVIADPPTVEVFVETYTTSSEPWVAYTSVAVLDLSPAEWDRLNEVCPQPG